MARMRLPCRSDRNRNSLQNSGTRQRRKFGAQGGGAGASPARRGGPRDDGTAPPARQRGKRPRPPGRRLLLKRKSLAATCQRRKGPSGAWTAPGSEVFLRGSEGKAPQAPGRRLSGPCLSISLPDRNRARRAGKRARRAAAGDRAGRAGPKHGSGGGVPCAGGAATASRGKRAAGLFPRTAVDARPAADALRGPTGARQPDALRSPMHSTARCTLQPDALHSPMHSVVLRPRCIDWGRSMHSAARKAMAS